MKVDITTNAHNNNLLPALVGKDMNFIDSVDDIALNASDATMCFTDLSGETHIVVVIAELCEG